MQGPLGSARAGSRNRGFALGLGRAGCALARLAVTRPVRVFGAGRTATRGLRTADEGGAHFRRRSAHPSGGLHREPELTSAKDLQEARALGLTSATGLVIGSIVGTRVFAIPAVLAGAGTRSLLVLGVIALGSMLLATMFGQLTRRDPDGGLYAGGPRLHRLGVPPIIEWEYRQSVRHLRGWDPSSLVTAANPAASGKGADAARWRPINRPPSG